MLLEGTFQRTLWVRSVAPRHVWVQIPWFPRCLLTPCRMRSCAVAAPSKTPRPRGGFCYPWVLLFWQTAFRLQVLSLLVAKLHRAPRPALSRGQEGKQGVFCNFLFCAGGGGTLCLASDGGARPRANGSESDGKSLPMSSDFQHYSFRMPNIGFQNLPLNIYIVVFGTAIFVFILSLLFCCYLIRLRHQAHKELYAYKQVILKEKVKELNLHEICAVCLEEFKPKDELGICPCKHAFHRKCLIKWLEVRKVCPLCNMPVLQLAQLHGKPDPGPPQGPLPGAQNIV
ncbi:RING finger protein 24 isoform X1 [Myiozetetes cayanensis]|nr:RING finger protein 24 isoform X1 [Myiozetetes cayanensis]